MQGYFGSLNLLTFTALKKETVVHRAVHTKHCTYGDEIEHISNSLPAPDNCHGETGHQRGLILYLDPHLKNEQASS